MESQIDEFLLQRVALGDEDAFALLYDRYGKSAYSLACRILGDTHSAEDVVQDVFLNIWRAASSFDSRRGQAHSWLLSMVHHRAIDVLRRRRGMPSANLDQELEQRGTEAAAVWQEVLDNLHQHAVKQALGQLPAEQRQAIEMAYFDGYTHREISELTQQPLGTVKSRIRIGMEKLRGILKGQEASIGSADS